LGGDNLSNLKWLAIDSFFAGLMLFGFLQSIYDHRWFFTIWFVILFAIDIIKTKYEYREIKKII
jgi:hypothetical protein